MTLPFLEEESKGRQTYRYPGEYVSSVWPGLTISAQERYVKACIPSVATAISSAVYGGGMVELDRIFNIYVDKHYRCDDPPRDIQRLLREWKEREDACTGLLTAVRLEHTSIQEYASPDFGLLCCTTAGVSNAARAGSPRVVFDAMGNRTDAVQKLDGVYTPGTINMMLWFNGCLTNGSMVNAIQTAVEAKAAALADAGVSDSENGLTATGTTTDAIVLAVSQDQQKPLLTYAGTATVLGSVIGRLVYDTIMESLQAGRSCSGAGGKTNNDT